jgi:two-component system, OmpR family, phosphate regulon sensor histidine kinase PhoR
MAFKIKKTLKFTLLSAFYVTLLVDVLLFTFIHFFVKYPISKIVVSVVFFSIIVYSFTLFVLRYRVEKFIYSRIAKLYEEIGIIDTNSKFKKIESTNLDEIASQIYQFTDNKKSEINDLNEREAFRREFLGNVSHELKTPLFTVQGYIETLLGGAMKDKELRKKYLGRASKGVERLVAIVNDLDLISKAEVGELNLNVEVFNLIELIQGVFDLLELKADAKNIILLFDKKYVKPVYIEADKEKIQQLFINLIENSIKYGKEDGTTELSIDEDYGKSKVLVKVIDNGEGIKSQNIPRLFERFFRVDKSGARSEGGSGLGLSIVKHIVEAHEQNIYVESQFGKGSQFSVTLKKGSVVLTS